MKTESNGCRHVSLEELQKETDYQEFLRCNGSQAANPYDLSGRRFPGPSSGRPPSPYDLSDPRHPARRRLERR